MYLRILSAITIITICHFQLYAQHKIKHVVLIGVDDNYSDRIPQIQKIVGEFTPDQLHIISNRDFDLLTIRDAVVLIKGTRKAASQPKPKRLRMDSGI